MPLAPTLSGKQRVPMEPQPQVSATNLMVRLREISNLLLALLRVQAALAAGTLGAPVVAAPDALVLERLHHVAHTRLLHAIQITSEG